MRLLGKASMRCRYGVTCVVFVYRPCLACTPPSLYLVSVLLGTAVPTSLNIFGKRFYTCTCMMKFTPTERIQ